MDNPILYKVIVASGQVVSGDCYLVGASLEHTGTTDLEIYDQVDSDATEAKQVIALKGSNTVTIMFPLPGIKCVGIYAKYWAGSGRVYYHY